MPPTREMFEVFVAQNNQRRVVCASTATEISKKKSVVTFPLLCFLVQLRTKCKMPKLYYSSTCFEHRVDEVYLLFI